jgi:hypothetical protein
MSTSTGLESPSSRTHIVTMELIKKIMLTNCLETLLKSKTKKLINELVVTLESQSFFFKEIKNP